MIYRKEKGTPLSADEVDGNFRELIERLQALEDERQKIEQIGEITLKGNELHIMGDHGSQLGLIDFPQKGWVAKGPWASETIYHSGDIVSHDLGLYCCLGDHKSSHFLEDEFYWKLLLSIPREPVSEDRLIQLYEQSTMPPPDEVGQLILVVDQPLGPQLAFSDGKKWNFIESIEGGKND